MQVCPPTTDYPGEFSDADLKEGKDCTFPEALKTVEEKCHGQEACSMVTAPEVFGGGIKPLALELDYRVQVFRGWIR